MKIFHDSISQGLQLFVAIAVLAISACDALDPSGVLITASAQDLTDSKNAMLDEHPANKGHQVVIVPVTMKKSQLEDIPETDVFQEGMLPDSSFEHEGADVWQCEADTNYEGDDLWIFGRHDGLYSPCFGWPYMKFDLAGIIPEGATVIHAVLSMYLDSAYGSYQTGASHKVLSNWNESSISFNSALL